MSRADRALAEEQFARGLYEISDALESALAARSSFYPWDDPGHTVDEDRLRATNVRKNKGLLHTVCWLPRHMTPTELGVITELAAVRYLLSEPGQQDLLETLGPQDRETMYRYQAKEAG